ncbi:MAG TPA: response regulator transcription factor [Terriglobia bacterium]|nr:response regulator transcription factor [Terriglobia bacterium]
MSALKIGIISDQTLIRKGLLSLLSAQPFRNLTLVVDAGTLAEAAEQIISAKPHILLIDCDHGSGCFGWIQQVEALSRSTKCLLLVDTVGKEFAAQAARSGAWGVLSKNTEPTVMQQAIEKIVHGEMWFSQGAMVNAVQSLLRRGPAEIAAPEKLTQREAEVLTLLAKGYHNKEIARRLCLSESTIRTYLETVYRKMGAKSRVEAALRFYERNAGMIPRHDSSD